MPYDVDLDPYADADSGVLLNRLGLTTESELSSAEAELTYALITSLMIEGRFTFADCTTSGLLEIHRMIFSDIYDWAGHLRTIELYKDDTRFAPPQFLQQNIDALMHELRTDEALKATDVEQFAVRLAHYYDELNVIHPFREGNGRAIRTFLAMLADNLEWSVAWNKMDPETNVQACIAGYQGDEEPLRQMLRPIIEPAVR